MEGGGGGEGELGGRVGSEEKAREDVEIGGLR